MTDMEKKEFMNTFIEKIELKNETVNKGIGQGSRIEHIDLAFPLYYGECKGTRIRSPKKTQSKQWLRLLRSGRGNTNTLGRCLRRK